MAIQKVGITIMECLPIGSYWMGLKPKERVNPIFTIRKSASQC